MVTHRQGPVLWVTDKWLVSGPHPWSPRLSCRTDCLLSVCLSVSHSGFNLQTMMTGLLYPVKKRHIAGVCICWIVPGLIQLPSDCVLLTEAPFLITDNWVIEKLCFRLKKNNWLFPSTLRSKYNYFSQSQRMRVGSRPLANKPDRYEEIGQ